MKKITTFFKRIFQKVQFRKTRCQQSESFTEELKTFYNTELLEGAKIYAIRITEMLGKESIIPKQGEVLVNFSPYKPLGIINTNASEHFPNGDCK